MIKQKGRNVWLQWNDSGKLVARMRQKNEWPKIFIDKSDLVDVMESPRIIQITSLD